MTGALVSHLWQSTWFAIAAGLLTLAFRRNRARVRYALWLCASAKFLVPFALLIGVGGRLGERHATTTVVPIAVEQIASGFAEPIRFASTPAATRSTVDWRPVAIGVWACGFLAIVGIRLRGWRRVRAVLRASKRLDIPVAVKVRSAPGLLEPGVVGLLRPVMLLPEGIVERLSPEQFEAVLAHELCHVQRKDNLFAAMHMLVEGMFWFHPLVWWIGSRMVEERERACDEGVLSLGSEACTYAEAILGVCKLYVESPLVCVSGVTGADLKKRIEAIMNNRIGLSLNFAKKLLLASAGAAALVGPVVVGVIIAGHVPVLRAQLILPPQPAALPAAQTVAPLAQSAPPNVAAQAQRTTSATDGHRLLTLLFDGGSMTPDEQSRAREAATQFVQARLEPADLVSVMVATNGKLAVAQDFTADRALLTSAIAGAGASAESSVASRLATLEQAARMLGVMPGKKALVYFSSGMPQQLGSDYQAQVRHAIEAAKASNVAFYPVDVRGASPSNLPVTPQQQRIEEARAKFGTKNGAMSRTYIRYGPPDQIEDRGASGQIWRYNYLDNFRSRVEFEFEPGNLPGGGHIRWPPPTATFEGVPRTAAESAIDVQRAMGLNPPVSQYTDFRSRHVTVQTYPAGEAQIVSVPLDGVAGRVDIAVEVRVIANSGEHYVAGSGRDSVVAGDTAQGGNYAMGYLLEAGSYVANVLVREQATGKLFSETVRFQVN
jgi:beta-lactamase regulating signal transducer with metallopeptidase domain